MTDEIWTVQRLLKTSTEWLQRQQLPSPRRDAEHLLCHVTGLTRVGLYTSFDRPVSEDELATYRALVARRARHEPIAYLTGSAGFWTLELRTDARALIPRPETELLIERVLAHIPASHRDQPWRVVDVGTGTGALAIALATELPNATVVAIDVSPEALELARENVLAHGLGDRVHLVHGDLLDRLVRKGSRADVIVSNPPYVGESERALMDPGVAAHEPERALFAGPAGFDLIDRLLPQARDVLAPGGVFVMEFGSPQGDGIRARADKLGLPWTVHQDLAGHDRALELRAPGRSPLMGEASRPSTGAPASPAPVARTSGDESFAPDGGRDGELAAPVDERELRNLSGLYGGETGTEPLPVIDLNEQ